MICQTSSGWSGKSPVFADVWRPAKKIGEARALQEAKESWRDCWVCRATLWISLTSDGRPTLQTFGITISWTVRAGQIHGWQQKGALEKKVLGLERLGIEPGVDH